MRHLLLLLCALALSACNSKSGWEASGTLGDDMVYLDTSTIIKSGDIAHIWQLTDRKQPLRWFGQESFSNKIETEVDCKNKMTRQVRIILYEKKMALGNVIGDVPPKNIWESVGPGSLGGKLVEEACSWKLKNIFG